MNEISRCLETRGGLGEELVLDSRFRSIATVISNGEQ